MRLYDTHTHIQGSEFDADRDAAIARAQEAGVVGMLVLGENVSSSESAIALAEAHEGVLAAAGCHPNNTDEQDDRSIDRLLHMAADPRVSAVGEIGLDFYREFATHERQLHVYRRQLDAAAEVGKPIAVHCREAHDTNLPIIEAWSKRLGGRLPDGRALGVLHYFSGDVALARRYVELGLLISVNSAVTRPKETQLQEVARELPLESLVVETDSPWGAPQSIRGKRNEPARVVEAVMKIAELRGEDAGLVAEVTTENALRLFAAGSKTWQRNAALRSV